MNKKFTHIQIPIKSLLGAVVKTTPNMTGKQMLESVNVKEWYTEHFPSDEFGSSLKAEITFYDVFDGMTEGKEFYGLVFADNSGDSIVRERIFEKMSQLLRVDYDTIYYLWLQKPEDDGFTEAERNQQSELYSEICRVLTDYENHTTGPDEDDYPDSKAIKEMYSLLVHVQNNWELYGLSMR